MARPLPTAKQSVNLATPAVRGSRIRRNPPPVVKEAPLRDPEEHERRMVVIGIAVFTAALIAILIGFSSIGTWNPRQHVIHLDADRN
jgi:hypothetical protein